MRPAEEENQPVQEEKGKQESQRGTQSVEKQDRRTGALLAALESDGQLTIAGHLRGAFRHVWNGNELRLTFDTMMKGQVSLLEREDNVLLLTGFMHKVFGTDTCLAFELVDDPSRLLAEENERKMIEEVNNHPIVQLTKEIFHGKILQIKRGDKG